MTAYYLDIANGDDNNDGLSRDTPKKSIEAFCVTDGDVVIRVSETPHPISPCPPCPDCGHFHRLSECAKCGCENNHWRT